jgi:hypothetical protein
MLRISLPVSCRSVRNRVDVIQQRIKIWVLVDVTALI